MTTYIIDTQRSNLTPGQVYEMIGYQRMAEADLVLIRYEGRLKAVKNRNGRPGHFPANQVPDENVVVVEDKRH